MAKKSKLPLSPFSSAVKTGLDLRNANLSKFSKLQKKNQIRNNHISVWQSLPDFEMKDVLRKVIFRQDVERRINGHSLRERHRLFSFQHKKSLSQKKPIFVLSCFRFPPIFVTNPP